MAQDRSREAVLIQSTQYALTERKTRYKRPIVLSILGIAVAACTTSQEAVDVLAGAHYPAGYADGCATAREAAKNFSTKITQDETLFENDAGYRSGWRQGYLSCKDQNSDTDDTSDMGIRKDN